VLSPSFGELLWRAPLESSFGELLWRGAQLLSLLITPPLWFAKQGEKKKTLWFAKGGEKKKTLWFAKQGEERKSNKNFYKKRIITLI